MSVAPTDLEIVGFVVSPRRRFQGRPADGPEPYDGDEHPTRIDIRAGLGVVGDRYFNAGFPYAAITFIAEESVDWLAEHLDSGPFDPLLARRNVITRGLDVDALVRTEFALDTPDGIARFRSITPANPCAWMNEMYAPGAHQAFRGRAGIRCEPLTDASLRLGPARLTASRDLERDELHRRVSQAAAMQASQ
ncbi:MOSC domain-containing protein [Aeromicrobium sp. YIM 150415]|uniref:MOSC domain-containing protein n=1 Tax=Aeromicrobium TaxID=2040 RepID=UPI00163D4D11|nr:MULTISPECIES: MOSC domain-containing protein [Aeromicrobium]MBM9463899.1 MOSC domain-containing protein [Aeromicrobium sp. YIM 150415]